jgi:hypothetical protein
VNESVVDQEEPRDVRFEIRRATSADIETVTAILEEVALWVGVNKLEAWDLGFFSTPGGEGQLRLRRDISNGDEYLICCDGVAVGTFVLHLQDEIFWPGAPADALYLHRFAVLHSAAGAGRRAILWMIDECRRRGRAFLRLDCLDDNAGICRYYESVGFAARGIMVFSGRRLRLYELGAEGQHR